MPTATTTVEADTITQAGDALFDMIDDAVDGFYTYTKVFGRPTLEQVNQIALRLAGFQYEGPACQRGLIAIWELTAVICIDDTVAKGTTTADRSGREIAQAFWRTFAGLAHVANQYQRTRPSATALLRCDDITFDIANITYEAGRAACRGRILTAVPTEPTAILGS